MHLLVRQMDIWFSWAFLQTGGGHRYKEPQIRKDWTLIEIGGETGVHSGGGLIPKSKTTNHQIRKYQASNLPESGWGSSVVNFKQIATDEGGDIEKASQKAIGN